MGKDVFKIVLAAWLVAGPLLTAGAAPSDPASRAGGGAGSGQATAGSPTEIHDIREPRQVGFNPAWYYGVGVGAAAAALLAGLVFGLRKWKKNRSFGSLEVTASVEEPPEDTAVRRLDELENRPPDTPADFYFQLSAIFREYIEGRYGLDAPEMTTEELLPRLAMIDLEKELRDKARDFLRFGDKVKFARAACDDERMSAHLGFVRHLVARTSEETAAEATSGELPAAAPGPETGRKERQ
ncbi:MAG: hypothetical protein ACLFS7_05790 [Desulfosudaceae bacterium]